jgi:NADH dehydrogenase FAD-containing subunit
MYVVILYSQFLMYSCLDGANSLRCQVHTMGSPLAHTSKLFAPSAWYKFSDMDSLKRPNIEVLQGSALHLDPQAKELHWQKKYRDSSGSELDILKYDYLVASTGIQRLWPILPRSMNSIDYQTDAQDYIADLGKAGPTIVVVGGGNFVQTLRFGFIC